MNNPYMLNMVSPEEYLKIQHTRGLNRYTLEELETIADDCRECEVCGLPVWKLGQTGLCFGCTTGCHDGSDDYELERKEVPDGK